MKRSHVTYDLLVVSGSGDTTFFKNLHLRVLRWKQPLLANLAKGKSYWDEISTCILGTPRIFTEILNHP